VLKKFNRFLLIIENSLLYMVIGYCVKCRDKREMNGTQAVTMKNGKPATKGTCPTCGISMFRIGKA
jgi:hypothetical protein